MSPETKAIVRLAALMLIVAFGVVFVVWGSCFLAEVNGISADMCSGTGDKLQEIALAALAAAGTAVGYVGTRD